MYYVFTLSLKHLNHDPFNANLHTHMDPSCDRWQPIEVQEYSLGFPITIMYTIKEPSIPMKIIKAPTVLATSRGFVAQV